MLPKKHFFPEKHTFFCPILPDFLEFRVVGNCPTPMTPGSYALSMSTPVNNRVNISIYIFLPLVISRVIPYQRKIRHGNWWHFRQLTKFSPTCIFFPDEYFSLTNFFPEFFFSSPQFFLGEYFTRGILPVLWFVVNCHYLDVLNKVNALREHWSMGLWSCPSRRTSRPWLWLKISYLWQEWDKAPQIRMWSEISRLFVCFDGQDWQIPE